VTEDLLSQLFPSGGVDNPLGIIIQLVWLTLLMLFFLYPSFGQRMQLSHMLRDLERKLNRLKLIKDDIRQRTIETVKKVGKPENDPTQEIDRLNDFFMIEPEAMDPYGVVYKLEHILETGETAFEGEVRKLTPHAEEHQVKTLTNLVEISRGIHTLYRVVRHYYLLGKKTANIYLVLQIQMVMPQLMEIADAYRQASIAFAEGQPIGDGVGVLVAAKLANGQEKARYDVAKDTIAQEIEYESRKVLVVRPIGPGGNVGRPGEGVKKLIEGVENDVKLVITIDAGLKLEGEDTGKVVEGVGVAIGGPGVDKYKIEEVAKQRGIPVYAFVVFESIGEAITPMKESIAKAADMVLQKVKKILVEKTDEGSTVIVAGIGNTVGIGM